MGVAVIVKDSNFTAEGKYADVNNRRLWHCRQGKTARANHAGANGGEQQGVGAIALSAESENRQGTPDQGECKGVEAGAFERAFGSLRWRWSSMLF